MSATRANLLVCVPTFRRPSTLRRLLESLGRQSVIGNEGIDLKVAVLDNDPAQSAKDVVSKFTAFPVDYVPVSEPGLAAVRNAAIRIAQSEADFLLFIDDDMEPGDTWIAAFLDAYRRTSCSILCGSQIPAFPPDSRKWIVEGGFFDEDRVEDLSEIRYGNSGNTFLECALFRRHALRFDPAFSFTGGEDTVYFARLRAAGEKILRVRSALVKDLIAEQRVTPRFLLSRAFRHGGTLLIADAVAGGWLQAVPVHLGKAMVRLAQAPFVALRSPARKSAWLWSGIKIAKSAGTVAAMFGFQIRPYAYGRNRTRTGSSAGRARAMRVLAWPIDPLNPYTKELYSAMGPDVCVDEFSAARLIHRYGIWHVHWPEALLNIRRPALAALKISGFLAMIDLVRMRGGKIIWTVHNLKAHDALHPVLEERFWRRFIPRVDGVISLSETGLAMAQEKFSRLRNLPAAVIPHGHYRDQYPPCGEDARAAFGIPAGARVILFFGELRPYKNVDALVRAFRNAGDANAILIVAGRAKDPSQAEALRNEAAGDSRIRLHLEFIAREQVAKYFAAADMVVLPYRQILNSGAALLALSFSRPVLVPDLGSMGNLKDDFGPEWVQTFSGDIDSPTLESALSWAALPRTSLCPMPETYRWESIRSRTLRFYSEVMGA